MRGLNARSKLACAKVQAVIHGSGSVLAEKASQEAVWAAKSEGIDDYFDFRNTPPTLFEGEPELLTAWTEGWHVVCDGYRSLQESNDGRI